MLLAGVGSKLFARLLPTDRRDAGLPRAHGQPAASSLPPQQLAAAAAGCPASGAPTSHPPSLPADTTHPTMSNELAEGFLRTLTQHRGPGGASLCFDTTALGELQLDSIRASPGRITAVLPVTPAVANRYGTLHGGCIGMLSGCPRAGLPGRPIADAGASAWSGAAGALASACLHCKPGGRSVRTDPVPGFLLLPILPLQPPWWTQWDRQRSSLSAPRAASPSTSMQVPPPLVVLPALRCCPLGGLPVLLVCCSHNRRAERPASCLPALLNYLSKASHSSKGQVHF